jgi:ferric-dicitrate binding protein FerR (iron transport regulator)
MYGRLLLLTFALAVFVPSAPLYAQAPETDAAPAHVAHLEGAVSLEREGRAESSPLNMPLLSGDRLRTGADGRVEVLFADGSTLHLDMRSSLDVQSDDLVRLTEGRLRLNILCLLYHISEPTRH